MIIVQGRELLIPDADRYIGRTPGALTETRQFKLPKITASAIDLSGMNFYLRLQYQNDGLDTVALTKAVDGDYIILTWSITLAELKAVGPVDVQIRVTDSATIRWTSYSAALYIDRHLNIPVSYAGQLTELEQIEQDHAYMLGVVDELKGNIDFTHTSEAWAIGMRNGVDVPESDETYHNNSKYYSEQAGASATAAAESATEAADTNNYLAPTGDTTDRTADIIAMLTSSKVCRLGTGDYYINGLQMPDNSAIIGRGSGTKIHLSGTADGYAIKPGSYCTLSDFMLTGSSSGLTFGDTIGGRHGILWQGNYTESQTAPAMCIMSNLYIRDFSGGGITCYDTGYGTFNAIEATNIIISGCWAGLNISYWSEFHKFTNVRCYGCRIGCVNNGGNNIFVNCDFSTSKEIGMLMDNSQSQSPNNSHGSCIGCAFNHTASGGTANSGVGIKMLNCDNGFIFSGCQIFFSKIDIEDSDGVVFSDCNIGKDNCNIIVNGGGVVLFTGNMHQGAPSSGTWISVTNNQNVHFVNCYVRSTGASVQPT